MKANWLHSLSTDPLLWLLEPDPVIPGVRYFALRDRLGRPADDPDLVTAQEAVMTSGPVPAILNTQAPEDYWVKPGPATHPSTRAAPGRCCFWRNWAPMFATSECGERSTTS